MGYKFEAGYSIALEAIAVGATKEEAHQRISYFLEPHKVLEVTKIALGDAINKLGIEREDIDESWFVE